MTAYAELVNAELVVLQILRAAGFTVHAERIGSDLPFILVSAAGGPPLRSDNPGVAQVTDIQIDVWAETKAEALDLYQQASHALRSTVRVQPQQGAGVLIRARVPQPNYVPDDDVLVAGNPAPRYVGVATVTVRP